MTREEAINRLQDAKDGYKEYLTDEAIDMAIKALEQESLTDTEQSLFLTAMEREEEICKEVDDKYSVSEAYEDSLVSICRSIERKVKKALWEG